MMGDSSNCPDRLDNVRPIIRQKKKEEEEVKGNKKSQKA